MLMLSPYLFRVHDWKGYLLCAWIPVLLLSKSTIWDNLSLAFCKSHSTCYRGCQNPGPNSLSDIGHRILPQDIIRYKAVGTSRVGTTD